MSDCQILIGDCNMVLGSLIPDSVQCCVTSPPYFGLRKYGDSVDELGQEKTPEAFISNLVAVFAQVKKALKKDGTLWVNIGDSYNASPGQRKTTDKAGPKQSTDSGSLAAPSRFVPGLKPKDLIGIPWMLAFALRADGWYLRSDIVWAKKNCMPESVLDRPTRSHEFIFLLSKSQSYFYDAEAIKEPAIYDIDGTGPAARKARAAENLKSFPTSERNGMRNAGFKDSEKFDGKNGTEKQRGHSRRHAGSNDRWDSMEKEEQCTGMRNKRDVWTVSPAQYPEAHFATFPADLIRPCILAGTRAGDTVLDPFGGSGTTGQVALEYGRKAILIDLYDKHGVLMEKRTDVTRGLPL
jgi:DNA modification methylase